MKKTSLKRRFIDSIYYGNDGEYRRERNADYCKVQFEWACFIDGLCKDGEITQKQYDNATF